MNRRTRFSILFIALALRGLDAAPIRMAATPALSPDGAWLAFEWRKDLWIAPATGGVARALTRHPAVDRFPVFSPDGRALAFMSERDGSAQIWRMDLPDGAPVQLTFHAGGAVPQDWTPDGASLIIRGARDSGDANPQRFWRIDATRPGPEHPVFDEPGDWARVSPDGASLVYVRGGESPYRRGYRGGNPASIWSHTLSGSAFAPVLVSEDGSDRRWPLWKPDGSGLYFVREEPKGRCHNLWSYDLRSRRETRLTSFTDEPVVFPCLARDGSRAVFRAGFDFYRLDLREKDAAPTRLTLLGPTDDGDPGTRRLTYTSAYNYDEPASVDFTEDGNEIVFSSGANLWVMDAKYRDPVPVTTGSDAQCAWASFSPSGDRILFLRDTGDRCNLWEARKTQANLPWWRNTRFTLTALSDDRRARRMLLPSPAFDKVAWNEAPGSLWVGTPGSNDAVRIVSSCEEVGASWSPDGRWLAVSVRDSDDNRDIFLADATGKRPLFNLSRQPEWDGGAEWSPDGRLVAWLGRSYDNTVSLYYAWMREMDEGLTERDLALGATASDNAKVTRIDFEGLHDRVHKVDLEVANPSGLFWSWDSKALAFHGTVDGRTGTWKIFFPTPGKPEFVSGLKGESVKWTKSAIRWSVDGVPHELEKKLPFTVRITRDEPAWRRLGFRKMWRVMRDEFYDEKLNNLDWDAVLARMEPLAGEVDEGGFDRLSMMLFGELNASHLDFTPAKPHVVPGDWNRETGYLGLRFRDTPPEGAWEVASVLPGSAADRVFSRVKPGDKLLRVDGREVRRTEPLEPLLDLPLDREVTLELDRAGTNVTVRLPLTKGDAIRTLARDAEEKERRARVQDWSKGRLGYLAIRSMKMENLRAFENDVYAEGVGRDGLVIDVRDNTGGFVADPILNILLYPQHAVTIPRGGEPGYQGGYLRRPRWNKPVVVICNGGTVSNGEIFSHAIKATGRGKLVGMPTQAGVISTGERSLLDLGTFRVPRRGWFALPSGLDMETAGAEPDITVDNPPGCRDRGEDPQLKAAVESLLKDLKKAPPATQVKYASGRSVRAD